MKFQLLIIPLSALFFGIAVAEDYVRHSTAIPGRGPGWGSVVVGEIDGNTANGKEIAAAGADGILSVFNAGGSLLWSADLPNRNCTATGSNNKVFSTPAIGELFGASIPYVVVGYGGFGTKACGGGMAAYHGPSGAPAWNFDLRTFAKKAKFWTNSHSVYPSPALADVNGDGQLEVGFGSFDRNLYLLSANGKPLWYAQAADTVWSSPAFFDVDGRSGLEMLIGTDISQNLRLNPPTYNGGYLYALRAAGGISSRLKLYRFRDPKLVLWQTHFEQTIFSSPVVADLVSENAGSEVIIGSGTFFPEKTKKKTGRWFKVLSLRKGAVLRTLEITAPSSSSAAIGDIDNDGQLEAVVTVNGSSNFGGDGRGRVVAWKPQTGAVLWTIEPRDRYGSNSALLGNLNSPVIADLDRNGSLEVLVSNRRGVGVYSGSTGETLALLPATDTLQATPAVADLTGDGNLSVIAAAEHLTIWSGFEQLGSQPTGQTPGAIAWGMFRGNSMHSGVYGD